MLEHLKLTHVGPAAEIEMNLGSRLNVITGDNGLGKSLLLDAAWFALTHTWPQVWPGRGIVPTQQGAAITWQLTGGEGRRRSVCSGWARGRWQRVSASVDLWRG